MHDAAIREYVQRGFSLVPLKAIPPEPGKSKWKKKPFVKWEDRQTRAPNECEALAEFRRFPGALIGCVTGNVSGICTLDIDDDEGRKKADELVPDSLLVPTFKTMSGGLQMVFQNPQPSIPGMVRFLPGLDYRGEGSLAILPPSSNGNGGQYRWLDGLSLQEVEPPPVPESLYKYISLYIGSNTARPQETTDDHNNHKMFEDGSRDNDLFSVGNALVKGGMPEWKIAQVLEHLIISWGEKPDSKWVDAKIKSALQRAERRERNITAEVREWVLTTTGHFLTTSNHKELQLTTREEMKAANMALLRLCEGPEPLLEKYGASRGCYRRIDTSIEYMDFANADIENSINLALPLGLHAKTKFFPKAVIVIAGVSGMGKTLFAFNTISENMGRFPIFYFNSEMGPEALKEKLSHFPIPMSEWAKGMKVIDNWDFNNIADKIQPDALNVVDYLEPEGEKPIIFMVLSAPLSGD